MPITVTIRDESGSGRVAGTLTLIVGDRQVTDLDEVLELSPGTDIRFIRLVQLAGG